MVVPDTSVLRVQLEDERERLQARLRELGAGEVFDEGFADSSQVTAERGELDAALAVASRGAPVAMLIAGVTSMGESRVRASAATVGASAAANGRVL